MIWTHYQYVLKFHVYPYNRRNTPAAIIAEV